MPCHSLDRAEACVPVWLLFVVLAVIAWPAACRSDAAAGKTSDAAAAAGTAALGGTVGTGGAPAMTGGQSSAMDAAATSTGGAEGSGGTTGMCCTKFGSPTTVGTIASAELAEISGIVASRAHPGVLYAHVDSGGGAVIYAMSTAGETLATFTLSGVRPTDWEDIAIGPGPGGGIFLYLGDTGDNAARTGNGTPRSEISVYRVAEPSIDVGAPAGALTIKDHARLRFTYPDAPHDCETLMVDPVTGDILLVSKEDSARPTVYRAAGSIPADTPTVLERVATLTLSGSASTSGMTTAGDISPSGASVMVKNYATIYLWCRAGTWAETFAAAPAELRAASEPQGEALSFSFDGKSWLSASETATTIFQSNASCAP